MPALSPEAKQLIDRPNFAHLATLMPDGSPQSVPVWIGHEGDRIVICTGGASLKAKNTAQSRSSIPQIRTKNCRFAAASWKGVLSRRSKRSTDTRRSTRASRSPFAIRGRLRW
jgi:hypothetical protein